tara:strand:+ start:1183 stop:1608 length:426 start_codon:yes stop_codon:yes gene_type:complete
MAHYAFIKDGIVTEVIAGREEDDLDNLPEGFSSWEDYYLTKRPDQDLCKRTSYNTSQSVHKEGGTPFRANYAGITDTYDEVNDVFIPQNPYPDIWVLNETNWAWEAPIPYPDDGEAYLWDNEAYLADTNDPKTQGWVAVNP